MITMTGSEFKRFYKEPTIWLEGVYWDDTLVKVDGNSDDSVDLETVADAAVIEIDGGYLENHPAGVPGDVEDAITWWRTKQTTTEFLIRVPKDKVWAVKEALALLGVDVPTAV